MRSYRLVQSPYGPLYHPTKSGVLRQSLVCITREMVAGVFDSQLRGRKDLTVCFTGCIRESAFGLLHSCLPWYVIPYLT